MSLGQVSIKRPTFIIAILMIVLTLGVLSYTKMSVRMFPDVEFPYVLVMTTYEGAGVEEIEQQVTKRIEDTMSGIAGVKHIYSINQESVSVVFAEFELSKDGDIAAQETRDRIGMIMPYLPDDVEYPTVMKMNMDSAPLVGFSLKADMSPEDLYDFADATMSNELAQVKGVSQVTIAGGAKREIHVDVDKSKLKEYNLSLSAIAGKIKQNSLNVPSGSVDRGPVETSYRTMGEFADYKEIGEVVVNFVGNDIPVKIKDIAKVIDSREKTKSIGRLTFREADGKIISENSLLLLAFKQSKSNDVDISNGLAKRMAVLNKKYENAPGKPQLTMVFDNAKAVRNNLSDVQQTIIEGIVLAIIVVYFFLGSWRSTFITALALPNSLIGAFLFMNLFGFSLNVFSLMSLSLAVGLLIDDAIVVRENIFRHYQKGKNPILAAIDGTKEVTFAVIATTAAVIAVFGPVAFMGGLAGKFFREFGLTIVFAMTISILDALTIAPMLSAYIIPTHEEVAENEKKTGFFRDILRVIVKVFRALTVGWFEKAFAIVLAVYNKIITKIARKNRFRLLAIAFSAAIFIFTVVLAKQHLTMNFMPNSETGEFSIDATGKPGTSIEQMDIYAKEIEKMLMEEETIEQVTTNIGGGWIQSGSNMASFNVTMVDSKQRKIGAATMKDNLRKRLNDRFKGNMDFAIKAGSGMNSDSALVMELRGADLDTLYDVSRTLMRRFEEIPYLTDIHSNYDKGKPEIRLYVNKLLMERFGVNSVDAGTEIRYMIDGATPAKYRVEGNEYDIRVQLPDSQKDIEGDLRDTYIFNTNGKMMPIANVAKALETSAPNTIYRKDKTRYITVEGNLLEGGTSGPIQQEAFKLFEEEKAKPENAQKWANVTASFSADAELMSEMVVNAAIAAALALLFIFLVLASLYESIITPFVIMTALPLAIIG
ncbi:MAG: efflux RND transporter permease subunit, partial [Elusimicrobiota bacterium]|nr:efflux RND transporter permease subunit [Elusimicrobiota bacterium]